MKYMAASTRVFAFAILVLLLFATVSLADDNAIEINTSAEAELSEEAPPIASEAVDKAPRETASSADYGVSQLDLSGRYIVGLEEALALVTKEGYDARTAEASFERARYDLDLTLSPFDPALSITGGYRSAERGSVSALTSSNVSTSKSAFYSVSLSETFPTGDNFSLSHQLARSEVSVVGSTSSVPKSYSGDVGFRWVHPLGRGYGTDSNWYGVRQTRNTLSYRELLLDETQRSLRYQVYSQYYSLVAQRKALEVREANLEAALKLHERNSERHKVGLSIRADVLQAENNVLNQKTRLIDEQKGYLDSLDGLAVLLGVNQPLDIDPGVGISPQPVQLDVGADWELVRNASASLRQAEMNLRNAELQQARNRGELRPDLDLALDYSREGEDATAGSAMRNLDNESYALTLTYTLPWHKRAYKARLAQGEQDLAISQAEMEKTVQQLRQDWEASFRDLASKQAQLDLAESNVEVARENYEIQVERNRVGLADTLDVIQAQESLLEAELSLLSAQVSYQTTYLQILMAAGEI
jgi:outer membrane protein